MGLHRRGEIKPATGTPRPATDHRQGGWIQGLERPAAVQITQGLLHAGQGAASGIFGGIVVAQNAGHRKLKLTQQPRQSHITISQIPHHQKGIRLKNLQQCGIGLVPLTVEISSDGESQHGPERRRF